MLDIELKGTAHPQVISGEALDEYGVAISNWQSPEVPLEPHVAKLSLIIARVLNPSRLWTLEAISRNQESDKAPTYYNFVYFTPTPLEEDDPYQDEPLKEVFGLSHVTDLWSKERYHLYWRHVEVYNQDTQPFLTYAEMLRGDIPDNRIPYVIKVLAARPFFIVQNDEYRQLAGVDLHRVVVYAAISDAMKVIDEIEKAETNLGPTADLRAQLETLEKQKASLELQLRHLQGQLAKSDENSGERAQKYADLRNKVKDLPNS